MFDGRLLVLSSAMMSGDSPALIAIDFLRMIFFGTATGDYSPDRARAHDAAPQGFGVARS
jgi:hypothetical protein